GCADVISAVFRSTIIQLAVPDALRGRLAGRRSRWSPAVPFRRQRMDPDHHSPAPSKLSAFEQASSLPGIAWAHEIIARYTGASDTSNNAQGLP
ncbi:MAG: hypothetical protein ACRDOH_14755, partial [Streptosporangiaceae bacterium]